MNLPRIVTNKRKGINMNKIKRHYEIAIILLLLPVALMAVNYTYSYDAAGRLTAVDYGNGASINYSYDNNGNLLLRQSQAKVDDDLIFANGFE